MLDHQPLTLAVAIGTLVLTALLYIVIPKGFFPVQDTGLIQVITEAPQIGLVRGDGAAAGALAEAILKDPDVDSLSSFIGVDGTNTTLNTGRMLVNLKPSEQRKATASQIIRRLRAETARPRDLRLHAAGPGPDDRRPGEPDAVPVRPGERRPRRAGAVDAAS